MNARELETWLGHPDRLKIRGDDDEAVLRAGIEHLLQTDFTRLVTLLYRIDIDESKLRAALATHPGTDASVLIAGLIRQRLDEKRRSREAYRRPDADIPEEERW